MTNLRWKIGDIEVFQIVEIEAGEVIQSIIPDATNENIQEISGLTPDFADENGKLKAVVQCFLVKTGDKIILMDTCNGNLKHRPDMPEWGSIQTDFLAGFRETKTDLHQVNLVICTHLHFDHVGWNTKLQDSAWVPTFPNAKYIFVRDEYNYWEKGPENQIASDLEAFQDSVKPIVDAGQSVLVDADYRVDNQVRLLPTPGHTPGHVCINIESKDQRGIFLGDLIYHPCHIIKSSWVTESDQVPNQSVASRKRILNEVANTDTVLFGVHFPNPVAVRVIRDGKGFNFLRV